MSAILNVNRTGDTRRISRRILSSISAGDVRPGQPLAAEVWARRLEAPVASVDAALGQLVADGVLIVGADRKPALAHITAARYSEIMLLRAELEGLAAAEAATRISPRLLRELNSLHDTMCEAESFNAWVAADRAFHYEIFEAAELDLLVEMIDKLRLTTGPYMYAVIEAAAGAGARSDVMRALADALAPVIRALESRDASAARAAMAKRVRRASAIVIAHLRQRDAKA